MADGEYDYHADFIYATRDELLQRRDAIEKEMADREKAMAAIDAMVSVLDTKPLKDPRQR